MRALSVFLGVLAGWMLACGFVRDAVSPPASDPPPVVDPVVAEHLPTQPARPEDATPVGTEVGPSSAQPVQLVQPAQVTIVNPEIPEGTVLSEVKADYEYLEKTGKIDACPEGTTLMDKDGTDGKQSFCALSNGVRHGPWIAYWPNGKVREVGPYVAGFRNGTFTTWNSRGKLNSRYTWTNGQVGAGQVF